MSIVFSASDFLALLDIRVDQANAILPPSRPVQSHCLQKSRPWKMLTDMMMLTPQRPEYTGNSDNLLSQQRKISAPYSGCTKNGTDPRNVDVLSQKLGIARSQSSLFVSRLIAKVEEGLRAFVTHHQPIRHSTDSIQIQWITGGLQWKPSR